MWISFGRSLVDKIHNQLINDTGGSHGVLNAGNIDAALASPESSFGGQDFYNTNLKKCCKLFHALVSSHGYQDGNKRIGLYMFLMAMDNCHLPYQQLTKHFLEYAALMIASGKLSVENLYEIVNKDLDIDK